MAKVINNEKGFRVIEVTLSDCTKWGGMGICDHCNSAVPKGYYVAVLNSVLCERCYNRWYARAKFYPEDMEIEYRNFDYMKTLLKI